MFNLNLLSSDISVMQRLTVPRLLLRSYLVYLLVRMGRRGWV